MSKTSARPLMSPSRLPVLGLVLTGLLAACNPDPTPPKPTPDAAVTGVSVTPAPVTLQVGGQQQLTASVTGTGTFSKEVTWTSSTPTVATVDASGLVKAVTAGQTNIVATSNANTSKTGTSAVTVTTTTIPPNQPTPFPADGLKINFQPAASTAPAGYTADTGAAYNDTRGYGWVTEAAAHTPLDVSANARDRNLNTVEARLNSFIHMQYNANTNADPAAVRTHAAWEYKLADGFYTVTVSTGDASNSLDSTHTLNIEGQVAIAPYMPADTKKFRAVTLRVPVMDGKLTIDAIGGTNTKINYVIIAPGNLPSVRDISPEDGETMVNPSISMTIDGNFVGGAIKLDSVNSDSVYLTEQGSTVKIPATVTPSGGGDAVTLTPLKPLKALTAYTFQITTALRDQVGNSFLPAHSTFVTGSPSTSGGTVAFTQVPQSNVPSYPYTSVEIGPDNMLYAATLTGEILRFKMQNDGTLDKPEIIKSVQTANNGPRTIIGLKFDPASTAENLILWISNNYFWDGSQQAPEWSGKITRLSGKNLETVQDYVVGLPRSIRDHETNSISFKPGENGALYVLQGSDSSTGAPDDVWGNRPEKLLNAAMLRIDYSKITQPPLNVKTAEGGSYNPYAAGAPLTLYATGIRNAYDMVWAKNGFLYAPANGAAASGNTPSTPAALPASCANRPDGPYTGPAVVGKTFVGTQNDYLFRVQKGKYYGHPNPERCEWVLNGGNPTAATDPAEVPEYPVGTQPDRNWGGFAYDFGQHASANGVIEEYTTAGDSLLKNRLLVVRYSAGKDIIVLTPGADGNIVDAKPGISGLTNFNPSPLDLTEDRSNGNLYVAQLDENTGQGTLLLVRPK
ncbi:Ig-like domain-containing protein [Deinococcus marmoris]|nr:Ig-like domain-containing protein [Deinococcus marmoris]